MWTVTFSAHYNAETCSWWIIRVLSPLKMISCQCLMILPQPGLSDACGQGSSAAVANIGLAGLQIPLTMTQRELEGLKRNEWFLDKHRGAPNKALGCTQADQKAALDAMPCKSPGDATFTQHWFKMKVLASLMLMLAL